MGNRKTINKRKGNNKTTNNFYQREERGENQKNLVKFEKDVQQKFIDIEENINNVEKEIKAEKKSNVFSNIVNVVLVIVSIVSIIVSSCNNMKTIKENRDLNKKTIEESRILNKQTVEMSKKIADRDYKLAESNQSLVIKEECTLEMVGDNINMDFTIEQGQPIATYLAINNSDNDQLFIKRMYPQIKNNTISISLPFVLEEDEAKENDIYLRMGTTNQLELIMLDSAGRIQRYYILVEPNVKSANETENIVKKVKKENEDGNDPKNYLAGTAELNYTLVTSPNIVFECNLINPETIDTYIESYKEEASDIKYGEDISGEKIYDNMIKINNLVKMQLF